MRDQGVVARIPVSIGELVDKITILELKSVRIDDEAKRAVAVNELAILRAEYARLGLDRPSLQALTRQLADTNAALWDTEEFLRACEKTKNFGDAFIEKARAVYQYNDRRHQVKSEIDKHTGSAIREAKSYA